MSKPRLKINPRQRGRKQHRSTIAAIWLIGCERASLASHPRVDLWKGKRKFSLVDQSSAVSGRLSGSQPAPSDGPASASISEPAQGDRSTSRWSPRSGAGGRRFTGGGELGRGLGFPVGLLLGLFLRRQLGRRRRALNALLAERRRLGGDDRRGAVGSATGGFLAGHAPALRRVDDAKREGGNGDEHDQAGDDLKHAMGHGPLHGADPNARAAPAKACANPQAAPFKVNAP